MPLQWHRAAPSVIPSKEQLSSSHFHRTHEQACWLSASGEKRTYEVWTLKYSVVWMGSFAIIIAFQLYESWGAATYTGVLGALAAPLVIQPLLSGSAHAARAQLFIAIFTFIGNYWYTHYFYCVLRARYTMEAWRLNDVPICMYLATHFYFSSYHVFSNLILRRVYTGYEAGPARQALFCGIIGALSYFTAFMETLTISHFPYYDFEDHAMAYTFGSAFYGIYFIVSFPAYFAIDEPGISTLYAGTRRWDGSAAPARFCAPDLRSSPVDNRRDFLRSHSRRPTRFGLKSTGRATSAWFVDAAMDLR